MGSGYRTRVDLPIAVASPTARALPRELRWFFVVLTIFTLGKNSDIVLDEFVYDPTTSLGKMTANVAKGTFRWVTGKIHGNQPGNIPAGHAPHRVRHPVCGLEIEQRRHRGGGGHEGGHVR